MTAARFMTVTQIAEELGVSDAALSERAREELRGIAIGVTDGGDVIVVRTPPPAPPPARPGVLGRPHGWGGHKSFDAAVAAFPKARERARVYFVEAVGTGCVKVGFTGGHIENRLRDLACVSPHELRLLATMLGGLGEEQALHIRFAPLRVRGEWFRHEGELAELIAELATVIA